MELKALLTDRHNTIQFSIRVIMIPQAYTLLEGEHNRIFDELVLIRRALELAVKPY